eukprot:TRINITY_DN9067_c0_g1_i2.p1 TRINITY_DN9067_c0_g1~~TRINITY_DN9067_c0_g1_i2.p1  ORF type:complete len:434 (+),score=107.35 TRINITY_DN9067_c0_g1_i2:1976-3277(+)
MYTSPRRVASPADMGRADCERLKRITADANKKKEEVVSMMKKQLEVADAATSKVEGLARMLQNGVSAEHLKTRVQQLEDELSMQREAHKMTVTSLQEQSATSVQLLTDQVVSLTAKLTSNEIANRDLHVAIDLLKETNEELKHRIHGNTQREAEMSKACDQAETHNLSLKGRVSTLEKLIETQSSTLCDTFLANQKAERDSIVLLESDERQRAQLFLCEYELSGAGAALEKKNNTILQLTQKVELHDLELSRLSVELTQKIYTLEEETAAQRASRQEAETRCLRLETTGLMRDEEELREIQEEHTKREKLYMKQISDLEEALQASANANIAYEQRLLAEVTAKEEAENEAAAATSRLASAALEWEVERKTVVPERHESERTPLGPSGEVTFTIRRDSNGTLGIANQGASIIEVDEDSAAYLAGVKPGMQTLRH